MIGKREDIMKFLNNNTNLEKETLINKIMGKFEVTKSTAQTYFYDWKKEFMAEGYVKEKDFKIRAMEFEGKNGTYVVNEGGVLLSVEAGLIKFENVSDIDKFVLEVKKAFSMID